MVNVRKQSNLSEADISHFKSSIMKLTIYITLILPVLCVAQSQFPPSNTNDTNIPLLPNYELEKYTAQILPLEHSLKKYCPTPLQQGNPLFNIGQALGYNTMTILYAIQNNWTNRELITQNAFSALYPYNIASQNRCQAVTMNAIVNVLQTRGNVPFAPFDKTHPNDCSKIPTATNHLQAQAFRVSAAHLFDKETVLFHKKRLIQKSLLNGLPIAVELLVTEHFAQHNEAEAYYEPNGFRNKHHALVIVGYDEYSFELMNTQGIEWGHGGFCKIRYEHFWDICNETYQLQLQLQMPVKTAIQGQFELRMAKAGGMMPIDWCLKSDGNLKYYENKTALSPQQPYQLVARQLQKELYVYVLGAEAQGAITILWPKKGWAFGAQPQVPTREVEETALVPYENSYFRLPESEMALNKSLKTEYYIVLYSKNKISKDNLTKRLIIWQRGCSESVLANFRVAFQDLLAPPDSVKYSLKQVAFAAPNTAKMIPIILKIQANTKPVKNG
jgi:hypothetical protein